MLSDAAAAERDEEDEEGGGSARRPADTEADVDTQADAEADELSPGCCSNATSRRRRTTASLCRCVSSSSRNSCSPRSQCSLCSTQKNDLCAKFRGGARRHAEKEELLRIEYRDSLRILNGAFHLVHIFVNLSEKKLINYAV